MTDSAGNYGFTLTGVVILGTTPVPCRGWQSHVGRGRECQRTESRAWVAGSRTKLHRNLCSESGLHRHHHPQFLRVRTVGPDICLSIISTITSGKSAWLRSLCNAQRGIPSRRDHRRGEKDIHLRRRLKDSLTRSGVEPPGPCG